MKSRLTQSWEESQFPIVCDACLGDDKHLRMTKDQFGLECRVCLKPFTCFRWCPGPKQRFRRTEICQACARLKHVCQSCVLDMEYGLPVQVRDSVLGLIKPDGSSLLPTLPRNQANRDYFLATSASRLARGDDTLIDYSKVDAPSKAILEEMSRRHGKRARMASQRKNAAPPCSFYAKGACARGAACPYRHELSADRPENLTMWRNRYFGSEDPLAEKIMDLHDAIPLFRPPEDLSVRSLFVAGLTSVLVDNTVENNIEAKDEDVQPENINEEEEPQGNSDEEVSSEKEEPEAKRTKKQELQVPSITDELKDLFGPAVSSVTLVHNNTCAIVKFKSRKHAEEAAAKSIGHTHLNGRMIRISWCRPPKSK